MKSRTYNSLVNLRSHYISKRNKALRLAYEVHQLNPYRVERVSRLLDAASFYRSEVERLSERIAYLNGTL